MQIHGHTVDDFQQVFFGQANMRHRFAQRLCDGMPRRAGIEAFDFTAPGIELCGGRVHIAAFINDVIYFAAESIECSDRLPPFRRQESEAVIKTRTAGGGFLLAICVRRHGAWLAVSSWRDLICREAGFLHKQRSAAQPYPVIHA